MIKDIIIIVSILIIIVLSGIITKNYLDTTTKELINQLKNLRKDIIEIKKNENDRKILENQVKNIYEDWNKKIKIWSIIVLHDELDLIETSLIKMKSEIENGSLEMSLQELDNAIFLVNHINEKEKLSWKNIL